MKKVNIILLIAGILSIILSIVCFTKNSYAEELKYWTIRYESYGGDAYTGIQNAAADTGTNVVVAARFIIKVLTFGFGSILLVAGCVLIGLAFKSKSIDDKKESQQRKEENSSVSVNKNKTCPNCGEEIDDKIVFCANCGTKLK